MAGFDEDVFGTAPKRKDKAEPETPEAPSGFDADVFSGGMRARAAASPLAPPTFSWDEPPERGTGSTTVDAANALGTGFNRGALALAGLPQDTLRNVIDLGKAGAALPWVARGKPVPKSLELQPREDIPMTTQWLKKQAEKTRAGDVLLNPTNPEYEGGYTQAAGGALSGLIPLNRAMAPSSVGQAVSLGLGNIGSTFASKAVGDRYGAPLGIAAGLAPTMLVRPSLVEGTKRIARGGARGLLTSGEADRQRVQDRIREFEQAGAGDGLTVGLATGNKTIGGLENMLYGTFGSSGVMNAAKDRLNEGMQRNVAENAALAAGGRGTTPARTGEAIQGDYDAWREQFRGNLRDRVYRRTDALIDPAQPTTLTNTRAALADLNAEIPGMERASQRLLNADLRGIESDLARDLSRTTPGPGPATVVTQRTVRDPTLLTTRTEDVLTSIPGGSPTTVMRDTAPFMGVRRLRTLIGDKMSDNPLTASIPRGKLEPAYAALSRDMEAQAALQDAQRDAHRTQGYDLPGGAARALELQNRYFRQGMNRLGELEFYTGKGGKQVSPEDALSRYLDNAAADGGNLRGLAAAKASLAPGTRGQVAGHWLGDIGLLPAGKQNERGDAFSTESYLTGWNKKSPEGQAELLSGFPDAERVRQNAERTAKVSGLLRENSKMWANPSGTAGQQGLRAGVGSLVGGSLALGVGGPLAVPVGALGSLAGSYGAAKLLTNPGIVRAVAQKTGIDPKVLQARLAGMRGAGLLDSEEPVRLDIGLGLGQ